MLVQVQSRAPYKDVSMETYRREESPRFLGGFPYDLYYNQVNSMKKQKTSKKPSRILNKKLIAVLIVLTIIAILGVISRIIYDGYFMRPSRLPQGEQLNYDPANAVFEGLDRDRYEFSSNNNQTLVGYNYHKVSTPKALIIFAHGLGGDHAFYKPLINALADRGYWVFAFDGTGTGNSDGDSMMGLEQHTIDLEYAIKAIQGEELFNNLKISLVGHSWGGYAVASVLNVEPKISSVVSISGFSSAYDLELNELKNTVGGIGNLALPFLKLTKLQKFGKYESYTGVSGFQKTNTPGLIIASDDDNIVAPEFGYKLYQSALPESRLEYLILDKRNHAPYWTDEAWQQYSNFMACMNGSCKDDEEQAVWDEALDSIYEKYSLTDDDIVSNHPAAWAETVEFLNSRFSAEFWESTVDEAIIDKIDGFITKHLR